MSDFVLKILEDAGAILKGHFVLRSGKHSEYYVNKDALIMTDAYLKKVIDLIVHKNSFLGSCDFHGIVGPAIGGAILAKCLAMAISKNSGIEIISIYTEKDEEDNMVLKRGYDKVAFGKKFFVIEDVITTSGSVLKTIDAIRRAGGEVTSVCCIVDRSGGMVTAETLGVPEFESLCQLEFETWAHEECLLCENGISINDNVGHGKKS